MSGTDLAHGATRNRTACVLARGARGTTPVWCYAKSGTSIGQAIVLRVRYAMSAWYCSALYCPVVCLLSGWVVLGSTTQLSTAPHQSVLSCVVLLAGACTTARQSPSRPRARTRNLPISSTVWTAR
eukprot:97360-Rhodomonas_salina.1